MTNANFIDYVKIFCRSGNGGAGSAHLKREKYNPKGGPDGGDGGQGGHVILRGNRQLWTLLHLKYNRHVTAEHGQAGMRDMKTGKSGEHAIIEVPLGTLAKDPESDEVLVEITEDGEEKILIPGGRGGLGNVHFKSATRQTPRYAQPGESGSEQWVVLELKVLADVGLVGFPNAGKSTLLSVLSSAKPKIADYPFTTLVPNLGVIAYHDNQSFIMADIPGIIEGAHEGKGLGLRFLRHIERNSVLLFLVPADSKDIKSEYETLVKELSRYNPELLDKNRILGISKSDMLDEELMNEIQQNLPDLPWIFFSSITQMNLSLLKDLLWQALVRD